MALDIYTPLELYAVMFDDRQTVATNWWLEMFFPNVHFSEQEEIAFDKINASRPIAPFMLPNVPGRPIYRREGERLQTFKPAYTKPKDAMRPSEALALGPGELARREGLMSPQSRFDREVLRITNYHRNAIQRLWDLMAARSIINGTIDINYITDAGTPSQSVTIDFGRDAAHTITLAGGSQWGDVGVSIFDDIQSWVDIVALAEFGGAPSDIIMGASAASVFMQDAEIKELLNTDYRGAESVNLRREIIVPDPLNPFVLLGTLGSGLRVWRCAGLGNQFQNDDKSTTDILGANEVVLVGNAVDGVRAYGAILDTAADLQVFDIFPKMWDEQDPSARQIMSQSAPLMIPVNPNATLKATVL